MSWHRELSTKPCSGVICWKRGLQQITLQTQECLLGRNYRFEPAFLLSCHGPLCPRTYTYFSLWARRRDCWVELGWLEPGKNSRRLHSLSVSEGLDAGLGNPGKSLSKRLQS